ncbi:MAG: phosphoribosyltransferase family protein [Candidatus Omnitrophota bacterium]|jgi:predicted phosphoribosyltransferase
MADIRIVSHSNKPFASRVEAGRLLAEQLKYLNSEEIVVLGIPRGGIIVAAEVAGILKSKFDIILSRKLGSPCNPELAIGAVSESGEIILNDLLVSEIGVDKAYIQEEKERQLAEISRRNKIYRKVFPKVSLKDRIAVIIDDGVATGATVQSGLMAVCQEKARSIIAAFPIAAQESISKLSSYADEIICLRVPDYFASVGQFYLKFPQVSDEEVIEVLKH